ncbi:hypothetical protein DVA76_18385, partial [Acinetobacter baumannii]
PFSGPFTTDLDIGTVTNSGKQSEREQKKGKGWHMSKVHRFGIQWGWQKHSERWLSAFPALAKQMELLFGFRGAGPQKGHRGREVEGWAG